jgi:transcriptional regulator with GAF, ATPase, and Fis domain
MVGASQAMLELSSVVRAVAPHSTSVLITGETGAGKELVAEALHKLSSRADKPFITVNCAAIPEALVEAELFGHTRGAFTGAVQSRLGKIHAAQGGTIFFDEIGELPLAGQAKLLRFLECGEVQRLGTSDIFRLDARVIAATNVDLEERIQQRLFREDLFYRLSVFPIELPPLRERCADIPMLARHFIAQLTGDKGGSLSPESEAKLASHSWPGNVRELRNVIERAFVLSGGHTLIAPEQILLRKPRALVRPPSESS